MNNITLSVLGKSRLNLSDADCKELLMCYALEAANILQSTALVLDELRDDDSTYTLQWIINHCEEGARLGEAILDHVKEAGLVMFPQAV